MSLAAFGVLLVGLGGFAPAGPGDPQVIGLVELPGLFGSRDPDGPPGMVRAARPIPVPLFAEADGHSARVATVSSADALEWREFDYEAPAAVAYGETEDGWVRVALLEEGARRHGWVPPAHRGILHALGALLEGGLAYLTPEWDGRLREMPFPTSASTHVDRSDPDDFPDVNVTRVVTSEGERWLKVELLGPGRCEGAEAPAVAASGWLPALADNGRPNAWFYSRGC